MIDYGISDAQRVEALMRHLRRVFGMGLELRKYDHSWIVFDEQERWSMESEPNCEAFMQAYGEWLAPHNDGIPF